MVIGFLILSIIILIPIFSLHSIWSITCPLTEGEKVAIEQLWIFFSVYDYLKLKTSLFTAERNAVRQMRAAPRGGSQTIGGCSGPFTVLGQNKSSIMQSTILVEPHPSHLEVLVGWVPRTSWRCSWWRPSPCKVDRCQCLKERLKK